MKALEPLAPEERHRVLTATAALYGVALLTGSKNEREEGGANPPADGGGRGDEGAGGGSGGGGSEHRSGKRQSVVEFLNDRQPATNPQRIACFAFYREHVEAKGSTFSKSELEDYFPTAKLGKPGNYDRDWNKAVKEGWIHDDGANSYLTQGGEDRVKAGFGGKAKPRGRAAAKKATRKAQSAA
jgi:hypothetical protein